MAAGTGRWALRFARAGAEVTALDSSVEMLAVARGTARNEGLPITFIEGPLDGPLSFPTEHFDLVVCALALCHVPDIDAAIAGCTRALRPGGHLLITDFHPQAIANGWETTVFRGEDAYILPNSRHSRAAYLDAVTNAGCQLIHVEEVLVREQPREAILWGGDVEEFLRNYGDWPFCLIVLGQRPMPPTLPGAGSPVAGHSSSRSPR